MSDLKKRLLIIEDETPIRDMLRFALVPVGFDIMEAKNVSEAEVHIATLIPNLILLDWMLPGTSGMDFAKQLKRQSHTKDIPIIMLTAKAEENNKIKGLETGADDYITKPFSPRELIARINTVLRRGPLVSPDGVIQKNKLRIDVNTHEVTIDGNKLELTPIEYKLLYFFLTHQERIYTRQQLLDQIWGHDKEIEERTIDVQIRRLRSRLAEFNYEACVKTVRGIGYQFSGQAL